MKKVHEHGVIIQEGVSDWQIFQQDKNGEAHFTVSGRWSTLIVREKVVVHVRLVREDGYEAVSSSLDWTPAITTKRGRRGTWTATLKRIPQGGLYRLETTAQVNGEPIEWSIRGDMRHHIGVGDVWVITGQSNAAGYGKFPVEDGPELGIHMFHADGHWKLATHPLGDSTSTLYPANREGGNASHSPWIAFARRLKQARGYPIGLIPASLGGSAIRPWDPKEKGELFLNMVRYIEDSGGGICGAVWYQGESDRDESNRLVYKTRFRNFVGGLRKLAKRRELPVITVQLNRFIGEDFGTAVHHDWECMREIQRQLSHEMKNVFVISIFEAGVSDIIHNDSRGNMLIADRAARTALGGVYGHDIQWRHPECVGVKRVADNAVELRFEHVTGRLHYESQIKREFPFAVRDRSGDVPVVGYRFTAHDRLRIDLGRALEGRATVTGVPSAYPPQNVPFDIPGHRPILGFTMTVDE